MKTTALGNHFIQVFRVASRGVAAQRAALGAATENLANANVSRTADGTPYRVKRAVQSTESNVGGRFASTLSKFRLALRGTDTMHITMDRSPDLSRSVYEAGPKTEITEAERYRVEYDPSHPDADEDGYVQYPDVNVVEEMASIVSANRLYEANLASVQAAREMIKRTIDI